MPVNEAIAMLMPTNPAIITFLPTALLNTLIFLYLVKNVLLDARQYKLQYFKILHAVLSLVSLVIPYWIPPIMAAIPRGIISLLKIVNSIYNIADIANRINTLYT